MVDPEVIEKIARRKIRYIRNYGDQNVNPYFPWQVALKTDNKQVLWFYDVDIKIKLIRIITLNT